MKTHEAKEYSELVAGKKISAITSAKKKAKAKKEETKFGYDYTKY